MRFTTRSVSTVLAWCVFAGIAGLSFARPDPGGAKPSGAPSDAVSADAAQPAASATPDKPTDNSADNPMVPGKTHEMINKFVGDWDTATKMEMTGMPADESKGSAKIVSVLGGRFLQETATGTTMGQQIEGFKIWGYNAGAKQFEATWAWTMNTSLLHMTGNWKEEGKSIEWNAWYQEDAGKKEEFKCLLTITDDDHFEVKMFGGKMPDGSPGPVMTEAYTRKGK